MVDKNDRQYKYLIFVLAVAYSNHEYKLICAYVDRQHKYVAFVLNSR